jgi:hypothetical protein
MRELHETSRVANVAMTSSPSRLKSGLGQAEPFTGSTEEVMLRNLACVVGFALIQVFSTAAFAADFGTAEEAKAMLERAVAAVKEDKAKALDMFNKGEGGFKDRDLYVWCANASDGIVTAHPALKGKQLRDIKGKHGAPFGETIMAGCHGVVATTRLGRAA